jgi:hypothetical protein
MHASADADLARFMVMRRALLVLAIGGCAGEPPLAVKPLPPLVAPAAPPAQVEVREIIVTELGLATGEHWIWEVRVRGFSIGRAELVVGDARVESRFRTGALASAISHVAHDLVTTVDLATARPSSANERIDSEGKLRQFTTQYAGTTSHSFHTALGAIRVWARAGASAGFLHVTHADQVFRLELAAPVTRHGMLRVDGKVLGDDVDLALTLWLDAAHRPKRIEIRDGGERVTAELISG